MTFSTPLARAATLLALMAGTSACTTIPRMQKLAPNETPVIMGPAVRDNRTPLEGVIACFADQLSRSGRQPLVVGVGDIKDYTGKYSINEGNAITQGGSLMVYSALGKMGGAVGIAERFDPVVAERELVYTDRRQLGDGEAHEVAGPTGKQRVPWVPYFGGTIIKSDYFIVGGVTELNYDIGSKGGEFGVNQIGVKARTFTQSVAVDLRIVDTKSLMVVKTVSLAKQFTGYEVGVNVFRFFGNDLFDVNIGGKGQEPLQLGIRAVLEEGVVRLIGAVANQDPESCISQRVSWKVPPYPAEELRQVPSQPAPTPAPIVNRGPAVNADTRQPTVPAAAGSVQIAFEFGSAILNGGALDTLDRISALGGNGIELILISREGEVFDVGKRDSLTDQRIAAIVTALQQRGIAPGAISITWRPSPTDTTIHRDGPGMQEIAKIKVGG
jgi:curli biogenesis system outer membrane secretion channel CsgG